MENTAQDRFRELAFQAHILFPGEVDLLERHVPEHAGRRGLAAPDKAPETGLAAAFERSARRGFHLQRVIVLVGDADLFQRGDERAFLDRHAAECERPYVPAAAELLGRVVPALLVRVPRDCRIEPGKRPLVGFAGKRDEIGAMGEPVLIASKVLMELFAISMSGQLFRI